MFTLIENGEIYAPQPMGRSSVLLAGSAILKIGDVDTRALAQSEYYMAFRLPYVAYALLESLQIMRNAVATFDEKCVRLIKAHPEKMRGYAERSVGVAALYNEERGFMGAAELVKEAIETGKSVKEVAAEE